MLGVFIARYSFELPFSSFSYIMAELLQTERAYVKDIESCIKYYMEGLEKSPVTYSWLKEKQDAIFLNMKDIYQFHSE